MNLPPELEEISSFSPSVDTRTLLPGDLFFALRGERDGHHYAGEALAKGAMAVVADHPLALPGKVIVVEDTLAALQELAARARRRWGRKLVAVTGSAGKTTTKDVIAVLLSVALVVGKTEGNFNNHIGLPLSLLRMPPGSDAAVVEIGMNHAGEIRRLAAIAQPDIAVVTNVGNAHVENFENGIEGVALAKRELIEALPPDGVAVLNADDARVLRFREIHPGRTITFGLTAAADVHPDGGIGSSRFSAGGVEFESSLHGRHNLLNLLAALAVARVFDIPWKRLRERVRTLSAGDMRGGISTCREVTIINDCYNSNPEAARSMLDLLLEIPALRHVAVLGEMLELGSAAERFHRELGRHVALRGVDLLVGVQGNARHIVSAAIEAGLNTGAAHFLETPEQAGDFLRDRARPGDAVLLKGSRGVALERALARFEE